MYLRNLAELALIACCASPTLAPIDGAAAEQDNDGFVSIFDGATLNGWEIMPASASDSWKVQNDIIVGVGGKDRSYLVFENKRIADFEIMLSYRFPGEGNSGISIRARKDATGKRAFQSYHADFGHVGIGKKVLGAWDFHTPDRKEHRCFRGDRLVIDKNDQPTIAPLAGALTQEDIRKNGWNHVHVIARGNHFEFSINGKPASEFTEHLEKAKRLESGMIQLQLHDPGMIVQFKDIRLKILE